MTATLEDRVTVLEGKVENLEINPQPGQNDAFSRNLVGLRREFAEFRATQKKQDATLAMHTGKLVGLGNDLLDLSGSLNVVKIELRDFKDVVSGRLERLDDDVAGLKEDVSTLKTDVSTLKTDVSTLKTDVSTLKTDMVEVKGALAEILERLPPRAA